MHLVAIGCSHKTAPVEVREALAYTPAELPQALARLGTLPTVDEVLLLSTCNRTEVCLTTVDADAAVADVLGFLAADRGLLRTDLGRYIYRHDNLGAAAHLFRVAAGLESMVLGETQVLGQVKDAYQQAVQAGTVQRVLHQLLHHAITVGKRVHAETNIDNGAASISYAAVELARKLFTSLRGRAVLCIGAGETAKLTVRHLQAAGVTEIWVANRTIERAQRLADQVGGQPVLLTEIVSILKQVDVVISSTGSPHVILTPAAVQEAVRQRRGRPIFLFDIAVPRDIDPACGRLDGAFLYDIDDLQQVVAANMEERAREAAKAELLLEQELERFAAWSRTQAVAPTIRVWREKAERIRQQELARALGKLPELSERERQVVEGLSAALVKKLLNPPTQRLLGLAAEGEAGRVAEALRVLFDLEAPGAESGAAPKPQTATGKGG